MNREEYLSEIAKCIRCGSCKALCPTYNEDSIETSVARGRIALLLAHASGKIDASPLLNDRIFSCTLCGACADLCPPGVDIKEIIYHGRSILKKHDKRRKLLRFLANFCISQPNFSFKLASCTYYLVFPYLHKKGFIPFMPEFPERQLRDKVHVFTVSKRKGRVAVFTGCSVNFLYPYLGESLINVLRRLGFEVILPAGEVCCGTPFRTLGLEEEAAEVARKNFDIFSKLNVEAVLSLCPTCTLTLKSEYPKLVGQGIDSATDISTFLLDVMNFTGCDSPYKNAVYHDPCHLKYGLGIAREPRKIIKNIGIDLIQTYGDRCCGFAGMFSLSNRQLSRELLNNCLREYAKEKSEAIITSCPGCIMQISGEVSDKPVLHLIEIIEEALMPSS